MSAWQNEESHRNRRTILTTKGETITHVNDNVSFFAGKRLENF